MSHISPYSALKFHKTHMSVFGDQLLHFAPHSMRIRVHPVVLFSILDHHSRRNEGQRRVIGTLCGRIRDGVVEIGSSFPVPHTENEDMVAIDTEYHATMLNLHNTVSPKETIVGWYATGPVDEHSMTIHEFYANNVREGVQPAHLVVDVTLQNGSLGMKAFTAMSIDAPDRALCYHFREIELDSLPGQSEKLAVDYLSQAKDADRVVESESEAMVSSVEKLYKLLSELSDYVKKVRSGEIECDDAVGRDLWDALGAITKFSEETLLKTTESASRDMTMILHLTQMTRAQLLLAERLMAR